MQTLRFIRLLTLCSILGCLFALSCKKSSQDAAYEQFDPVFARYIAGYTTGEVSRTANVQIQFTQPMIPQTQVGTDLSEDIFDFSPDVSGTITWKTPYILQFAPEKLLQSNQLYRVALKTSSFNDSLPDMPDTFKFQFRTLPQSMQVELAGLKTIDLENFHWQQLSGTITTQDYEANEQIEDIFLASLGQRNIDISWEHTADNYVHDFTIDSIPRSTTQQDLVLTWNGKPYEVNLSGKKTVSVPQTGNFTLLDHYVVNHPQQYVQLIFSDPLNPDQNLQGLIDLQNLSVRYNTTSNQVRLYPNQQLNGTYTLTLNPGIQNRSGKPFNISKQFSLDFEDPLPQIRLVGKGVILPQAKTLPFVFETVGLRAIDVRVIKVFEDNVLQFLQASQLFDNNEINRVGQVITLKEIELDKGQLGNPGQWSRHSLDLSNLISPEPGAIYEVALGFRPQHVQNPCVAEIVEADEINVLKVSERFNTPYWYGEEYYGYDWEQRDNPCHRAYYRSDRIVKRNVLASEIGIIAKQGATQSQLIVSNIHSTEPMEGVALEIYDFQQRLIASGVSDVNGQVNIPINNTQKPYVAVAKQGNQRGYLRLDEGSALTLSRFDIGGSSYQEGLKGYLYGERGVWRPGDDIFLTFLLEDEDNTLPSNHPVSFKFTDPQGKTVSKLVKTEGLNGFYTFPVKTEADAITGNYRAEVQVGGATFDKTIKVETITPNRLKIDLSYNTPILNAKMQTSLADLNVEWLHGAPASDLDATVSVSLSSKKTQFDSHPGFVFDDPVQQYSTEEMVLFEGKLDQEGTAQIKSEIPTEVKAPGMLNATFRTQVFEPGGGFSIDQFTMDYHPYDVYVGIRNPKSEDDSAPLTLGDPHTIEFVTLDQQGKPVSRDNLRIDVYKLEWRWWWEQSYNDFANYQGKLYVDPIQSTTVSTQNGKGAWALQIEEPNWGRYLIRIKDQAGHTTGEVVYVDYPGWFRRGRDTENEGAKMLTFSADKDSYQVGEKVTLSIPTGFAGRALVSIEQGSDVLSTHWITAAEGMTQFSFSTTGEMAPNVYAHVTLLQPHAQTENDLPIRMYGVIPILIEDPKTYLKPEIVMPQAISPNSTFDIKISEASGNPMTYTLAVVDEGLLDITRYNTPDPHNFFYQREALQVKTWDLYDQVVGAYGGEIGNLLSIGGGMEIVDPDASKQNRFTPYVKFLGPFELEKGKTRTHELEMGNYIGSVRTMVVAAESEAYGQAEVATPVKQPLMVLGSLPRVLGPEETVILPATIFAMEDRVKNVSISVEVDDMFEIEGTSEQNIRFDQKGEKLANFKLTVKPYPGTGHIKLTARSGNEVAYYETDVTVRIPNPTITEVSASKLLPRDKWNTRYQPMGVKSTNEGFIEVSAIPPLNLAKRLPYLIRYPYGCLEQVTSSAFPQVYLSQLTELSDSRQKATGQHIRAAIDRLRRFQLSSGGFAYWPGLTDADEWSTNYVGHFLLEAQNAGYYVPADMLTSWKDFQRRQAEIWINNAPTIWLQQGEQLTQAYRLYLLALADAPSIGAMNRLRQIEDLYLVAKYQLAAAYFLAGQRQTADRIQKGLSTEVADYRQLNYTYGSSIRDKAILLETLCVMDAKEKAEPLVTALSSRLASDEWLSTQSTAYCLIAIAKYTGRRDPGDPFTFTYQADKASPLEVSQTHALWQKPLQSDDNHTLALENTSDQTLYVRLVSSGIPLRGDNQTTSNGVELRVAYTQLDGSSLNPAQIVQGTEFIAKITVTHTGDNRYYKDMALTHIFPSGWQVFNSRLYNTEEGGDEPSYLDQRDDRVHLFFDLERGKSKTFNIRLNASYIGRYYLPSVYTEAMYDASISARIGGNWVEVLPPSDG